MSLKFCDNELCIMKEFFEYVYAVINHEYNENKGINIQDIFEHAAYVYFGSQDEKINDNHIAIANERRIHDR